MTEDPEDERPHTIAELARIPRGPRARLTVCIDEGPNGGRFVSIRRWMLGKQNQWISPRGVCVQRGELRTVGWALLKAADELEGLSP